MDRIFISIHLYVSNNHHHHIATCNMLKIWKGSASAVFPFKIISPSSTSSFLPLPVCLCRSFALRHHQFINRCLPFRRSYKLEFHMLKLGREHFLGTVAEWNGIIRFKCNTLLRSAFSFPSLPLSLSLLSLFVSETDGLASTDPMQQLNLFVVDEQLSLATLLLLWN